MAQTLAVFTGLRQRIEQALADLHTWLGFIALDDRGAVEWAYPVTVANTPHHLAFESGERMSGA